MSDLVRVNQAPGNPEAGGDNPVDQAPPNPVDADNEQQDIFDEQAERIDPEFLRERTEYNTYLQAHTRLPKNEQCPACQLAKMKQKYAKRGAFKRVLTKFGDLITFDHIYSK